MDGMTEILPVNAEVTPVASSRSEGEMIIHETLKDCLCFKTKEEFDAVLLGTFKRELHLRELTLGVDDLLYKPIFIDGKLLNGFDIFHF